MSLVTSIFWLSDAAGQPGEVANEQTGAAERQGLNKRALSCRHSVYVKGGGECFGPSAVSLFADTDVCTLAYTYTHAHAHTHTMGLPCLSLASVVTRCPSAVITQHTTVIVDFTALDAPYHGI